ncbi:MAG: lytic transglycosylase domain-containing protein [Alphaproteobacteria bacterium]|nr:lytic transglycosylase domain-containing protein [Alphaproteobacteria bacterium]
MRWSQPSTLAALAAAGLAGTLPHAARAQAMEPLETTVCRLIENSARANHLPVSFLTRVIWRESSFRAGAVSPAGAMGIAQFMPGTAVARGLANPFDPEQAIPKAAHFLADLRQQFGSLGNAAAAYNAGPARVANWLNGQSDLPAVTLSYMRFVTEGADAPAAKPGGESSVVTESERNVPPPASAGCVAIVAELRRDTGDSADFTPLAPWGVQLAGNFSKAVALASFARAERRYVRLVGDATPMIIGRVLRSRGTRRYYQVRLPAQSRQGAETLCARILSVGGSCVAVRS